MTAPYPAPYTDEEFEKLLQDVNDFPSSINNPGLGLDFSVLPSIDDIDTSMTSLCELPAGFLVDGGRMIPYHYSSSPILVPERTSSFPGE